MLVFNRRIRQKVMIGNDVTVTVLAINGSQVRIGVDAPREITVDREEIYLRKVGQLRRLRRDSQS